MGLKRFGAPVYVRKEIVHNRHVVESFRAQGVVFVEELSEVPDGAMAVFSAHGVSPAVRSEAERRNLRVLDATCPLVTKVHAEVGRFVGLGYHIILIGRRGHEEVDGTLGCATNDITLIEDVGQAKTSPVPQADRLMVLTQTTLGVDDTKAIVDALRARFPHIELPPTEDICYATQNRQNAIKAMCDGGIDFLIVVGSQNSSNAARLVEVGDVRGVRGILIDSAAELAPDTVRGVSRIGVSGGASTPDALVQGVVERLKELGADSVEVSTTTEENTVFKLPEMLTAAEDAIR